jgi:hypothetical protein
LIAKRGNLSAPGLDGVISPFLKLERETEAELIIVWLQVKIKKYQREYLHLDKKRMQYYFKI